MKNELRAAVSVLSLVWRQSVARKKTHDARPIYLYFSLNLHVTKSHSTHFQSSTANWSKSFFLSDGVAVVKDARCDTCSRNILREEDLAEHIELSRVKDHFICKLLNRKLLRYLVKISGFVSYMAQARHRLTFSVPHPPLRRAGCRRKLGGVEKFLLFSSLF